MSSDLSKSPKGSFAPVLDAALLERIQALNLDFIELLIAEQALSGCAAQLQHLPPGTGPALARLPDGARRSLAATPYTLYSLGFEDQAFWRTACEGRGQPFARRYECVDAVCLSGSFCEIALLHAWHVAASNPLAARVLYAMPDAVAGRLVAAALWRIRRIAEDHPQLLTPRWPTNPAFWPDLARFAAMNDERRLRTTQQLGSQLVAAELEQAALHAGFPSRPGMAGSPRLRARKLRFEPRIVR